MNNKVECEVIECVETRSEHMEGRGNVLTFTDTRAHVHHAAPLATGRSRGSSLKPEHIKFTEVGELVNAG